MEVVIKMTKRRGSKGSILKKGPGLEHVGSWAFIIGAILAVLFGLTQSVASRAVTPVLESWAVGLLVILGLIVGLLNVTHHEAHSFVYVTTALVLVAYFGTRLSQGDVFSAVWGSNILNSVLGTLITFVMPATVVVSLRAIWELARHS